VSKSLKGTAPSAAQANSVVIGVISDTHGLLRQSALAALEGSDRIIHAGDIGGPAILQQLHEIAPVTAVRGNVDRSSWTREIPAMNVLEASGVSIYILHSIDELDVKPEAAGFAAVVYGHSHIAKQEVKNGVLYFNPGSAGPRRFDLPVSVGRISISNGKLVATVIELRNP
jgi:putative phosphoesterase